MPDNNDNANSNMSTSLPPVGGATMSGATMSNATTGSISTTSNISATGSTSASNEGSNSAIPDVVMQVAQRINESRSVLIALSSDPSVDEMAAAIGLSLYLDRLGKRATAIYSGSTPNALEFLNPEKTFENSVDSLRDFVIALNKDKADHLRYKLEGDYVRIFITPYKTKITESDLEFSYGDFNVDLVIALNVANGIDLDAALREHGRIMHDAVIVDITTSNPGKLGEIEWSNKRASSVSEMVSELLYAINSNIQIDGDEATAFLTGIVAATDRFKNANTTPETMVIASKLMESGANHQLISKNITPDTENKIFDNSNAFHADADKESDAAADDDADATSDAGADDTSTLDIKHPTRAETETKDHEADSDKGKSRDEQKETWTEDKTPAQDSASASEGSKESEDSSIMDDLKAAEASLSAAATEVVPEAKQGPVDVDNLEASAPQTTDSGAEISALPNPSPSSSAPDEAPQPSPSTATSSEQHDNSQGYISNKTEKVLQPLNENIGDSQAPGMEVNKYGKMLEDALNSINGISATSPASSGDLNPVNAANTGVYQPTEGSPVSGNPATMGTPAVSTNPEINGVPEINYMPMPGEEVLPPPPAPPIDTNSLPSVDEAGAASQPAAQGQPGDQSAFKIPGLGA